MFQTSLDSTECDKLKEYMPIPWGGFKILGGTINCLFLLAGSIALGFFLTTVLSQYVQPNLAVLISGLTTAVLCLGIVGHFTTSARREWIDSYFNRNVVSYRARFWVDELDDDGVVWECHIVTHRSDEIEIDSGLKALGGLIIEIPLGGWFKFLGARILLNGAPVTPSDTIRFWRVRLRKIVTSNNCVVVDLRNKYGRNQNDERIPWLSVEEAIRFLHHAHYSFTGELSSVLEKLLNEIRELTVERDRLKVELTSADKELKDAIGQNVFCFGALRGLQSAIAKTDRLKTTLDGLRLHEQVLTALVQITENVNQSQFEGYSNQLALVRSELDKLQRSNTRRLGNTPAPASPQPARV